MANAIHVYKVEVSSREDNWPRSQEQVGRVVKYLIQNDGSLDVHNVELIETKKQESEAKI